jgi:hypothetical protein
MRKVGPVHGGVDTDRTRRILDCLSEKTCCDSVVCDATTVVKMTGRRRPVAWFCRSCICIVEDLGADCPT